MNYLQQAILGICLIIATGGTVAYIHSNHTTGIGLAIIVILYALLGAVGKQWTRAKHIGNTNPGEDVAHRLDVLEKRLTDIQDVVLSIDDHLNRKPSLSDNPTP